MFADPLKHTSTMDFDDYGPAPDPVAGWEPRRPLVNPRQPVTDAERDRRIARAKAQRRARHSNRRNRK